MNSELKRAIKTETRRLGFVLAGVTSPEPPSHLSTYERWLAAGMHTDMHYLGDERARTRRADPRLILPECQSILVLALPHYPPSKNIKDDNYENKGRIAAYAWGDDYHIIIPPKLRSLVVFIEEQLNHSVSHRIYTDTGPILERDLAQRAGLGWIGKNTNLINPKIGSYFLLAEILLGLQLEPDAPFLTDQCGTCTRCIDACPTHCILPDRTLDARHCISYLTIENKGAIPEELRQNLDDWVFGCDVCQMVCPWNSFALQEGDASFAPRLASKKMNLIHDLMLSPDDFRNKFKDSPIKRAKRRGYLRNVAVALGNAGNLAAISALEEALNDPELLVREHAAWALEKIKSK